MILNPSRAIWASAERAVDRARAKSIEADEIDDWDTYMRTSIDSKMVSTPYFV